MSAKVAIIMGSHSDWETMKEAELILKDFGISVHKEIVSAHRSPELMLEFSKTAKDAGYSVIIAGAGGAAHLPGMVASMTTLPVLGVPIQSKALNGLDSLLSIVQMPGGVPVGTLAIGAAGAKNAALLAIRILSLQDLKLSEKLSKYRDQIREDALSKNKDLL
ncbi:5-(carboxyamino)imidazole ribonucleotide mutase [Leptospira adleri]|uniref:N5-carboxyaminoimidazole ribonucleotide mutase n=1 Tax=Leptospira adleri TaxID=2023186 RepID=A0A2M9YPA8_9LEPT|nr:5-(carboxyamino)imidazole ribonucleotide mutase [Leptospira adleri]PJZ53365.1 5-(carboxyamino)imidazole ribonucleotide mutase [Leptospira adleri]PJZ64014.1 5-(carboxyamino)imidazole ribonucleotide mutase [Leptospira adleri]TGM52808.1 5-(carboxyamino)imidazole ribonucleotide mutase [Leptospira adleri]